jgi:hypothetical protein
MLVRNVWGEKTLGEMWAAVIKTINNLLRTAWLLTQAPRNGDRAGVSICPEGDHKGRTRKVPLEDRGPSMYIIRYMYTIIKRCFQTRHKHTCWEGMFKMYAVHCTYIYIPPPHIVNCCLLFLVYKLCMYNNRCLFFAA